MAKIKASDLRELSDDELHSQLEVKSSALRDLRFQMITGSVEDVCSIRNTRRDIARVHTILREREMATQKKAKTA